ncbi:MAG TPA: helix-turn-helix transcriptional regulator [Candidatus Coprenecus merdigallinarum]|nr:helix-turn-helix transcriptional regulator [Candidatus Coprenecus merdigallinarum]
MNDREIKKRIESYRRKQKLSQADLAEKLSISQTAYYKIEKGNTSLISDHLPKIASALNLPEEALVLGYDPKDVESLEHSIAEKDRKITELEATIADKNRIIALQEELLRKN